MNLFVSLPSYHLLSYGWYSINFDVGLQWWLNLISYKCLEQAISEI